MSNAPLDHVKRVAPSWARTTPLTECGRGVSDTASTISLDALIEKVKKQGKTRASMSSCMTCWSRVSYGQKTDPVGVATAYLTRTRRIHNKVALELEALEALVAAHQDEYDELVSSVRSVSRIGQEFKR